MMRHLEAVALAVANADPRLVSMQVRRAYAEGATVRQVLTAIDVGRCLAAVPPSVVSEAWHAADAWAWIGLRQALR
jgi:alkylhydroperoxidase/carboxymuconolactone decarboxylase family protein YurZ